MAHQSDGGEPRHLRPSLWRRNQYRNDPGRDDRRDRGLGAQRRFPESAGPRIAQDNTQELAQVVQGRADTLDVALGLAVGALVAFVVLGVLDFNYSLADRLGEVQRAVR